MAKWVSLVIKAGALVFILFVPTKFAIDLQLLGGIWIIQTHAGRDARCLYTRWFNSWALLIGWAAGTFAGTLMAVADQSDADLSAGASAGYTFPGYTALYTLILNLVLAVVSDAGVRRAEARASAADATVEADYRV